MAGQVWGHSGIEVVTRVRRSEKNPGQAKAGNQESSSRAGSRNKLSQEAGRSDRKQRRKASWLDKSGDQAGTEVGAGK